MLFAVLELRRRYPNRNATTQPSHSDPVLSNDDDVTSSLQHTARSPISLERIHLERGRQETHRTPVLLERAIIGDRPNGHDDKRTTSELIRAKQGRRWRRVDEQPSNLHRAAQ